MASRPVPLPPVAAVVSFIDAINHRDLPRLLALMTEDHALTVLDEAPSAGVAAMEGAWRGYFEGFPTYVIYPHRIADAGGRVAVLGHTTGSHLGLPDDEERRLLVIWTAEVRDGRLATWTIVQDSTAARAQFGLD